MPFFILYFLEHPVDLLGRFRVIGKSNLQIHRVRPSDAGTYNCMVDDTHLQASADLIVLGKCA